MTAKFCLAGAALVTALTLVGCNRTEAPPVAEQHLTAPPPTANSTTAPAAAPAGANPETAITPAGVRVLDPQAANMQATAPQRGTVSRQSASARADDAPRYVVKKRSKKASAGIIGGSAAAGAAIGALAGGGKGAAIGAIAGGTAGVVYDRSTAKKKQRIE